MAGPIAMDRDAVLEALRHLGVIVPSLARIGSAGADLSKEDGQRLVAEFIDDWDVARRLAAVRRILSEGFDYDELEGVELVGNASGDVLHLELVCL